MFFILSLLAIAGMSCLNHIRGGWLHKYFDVIPGRGEMIVATVGTGLIMLALSFNFTLALGTALLYVLWAMPAWGRWFDMGRKVWNENRLKDAEGYEAVIEWISGKFGSYNVSPEWFDRRCMLIRHNLLTVLSIPFAWYFGMWGVVPAAFLLSCNIVVCYELAWDWKKSEDAIQFAEFWVGILWGLLLIFIAF
jgi:hypothetical protein